MYYIENMPSQIDIGFTGELMFRKVEIDMSAWMADMPDGVPSIVHIRPEETEADAYIAATTFENNILTWDITNSDLGSVEGVGTAQIWLEEEANESIVKRGKSILVATMIHQSINDASEEVPAVQAAWMEQMTALKVTTVNAKDAAEAAVVHGPRVDQETGNWLVWDQYLGEYVDTGITSRGQMGAKSLVFTLDDVTNVSGSYTHTTVLETATNTMKPIALEVGSPTSFNGFITVTCNNGSITVSCPSVSGSSTLKVIVEETAQSPYEPYVTSEEFAVLKGMIGTLASLDTEDKANLVEAINEVYSSGGGGGGTSNYNYLNNKPKIAGVTLSGDKSLSDFGIASQSGLEEYADEIVVVQNDTPTDTQNKIWVVETSPSSVQVPTWAEHEALASAVGGKVDEPSSEGSSGQVLTTDGNGGRSWTTVQGSGSSNYNDLSNKPQIAGTTLSGNKSLSDLGIAAASAIPDVSGYASKVTSPTENNFAALTSAGDLKDSGKKASDFLTSHQDISGKADKVTSATNGHFAGLDSNGNLTDSGKSASDFGTYSKPSGGIPSSDLASAVATSLGKADTAYQKPSGGIPGTDLAKTYIEEPSSEGTSGQVLTTDGNGGRTWTTIESAQRTSVAIQEQTITVSGMYTEITTYTEAPIAGETYIVTVNGTAKTLEAESMYGNVVITYTNDISIDYANGGLYFSVEDSSLYGSYVIKVDKVLPDGVTDVQVNSVSVVNSGVANLALASAAESKAGTASTLIVPSNQHNAVFYGLAKAASDTSQASSSNAVGVYTSDALIKIQKMLNIYQAPWEVIIDSSVTNATEASLVINQDSNGNSFSLTDVRLLIWFASQNNEAKLANGTINFFYGVTSSIDLVVDTKTVAANSSLCGAYCMITQECGMIHKESTSWHNGGVLGTQRIVMKENTADNRYPFQLSSEVGITSIQLQKVTGTLNYRVIGKRKWRT